MLFSEMAIVLVFLISRGEYTQRVNICQHFAGKIRPGGTIFFDRTSV